MTEALARTSPGPLVAAGDEWQAIREQAAALIKSGFMPRAVNTPEKAVAVMLAGRELGLPPMQSIRAISIVDGKPTLSAETMLALAYQRVPGLTVSVVSTPTGATVSGARRPNDKATTITFGQAQAQAAGLLNKDNWRKYPEAMYRARAISAWCRVVCPDAILGCYTPDEMGDTAAPPIRAIDVTHEEVIDDPRPTQEEPPAAEPQAAADRGIGRSWPDEEPPLEEPGANDGPPPATPPALISEPQRKRLYAISKAAQATNGWTDEALKAAMTDLLGRYGFEKTTEIARDKYDAIVEEVQSWK